MEIKALKRAKEIEADINGLRDFIDNYKSHTQVELHFTYDYKTAFGIMTKHKLFKTPSKSLCSSIMRNLESELKKLEQELKSL